MARYFILVALAFSKILATDVDVTKDHSRSPWEFFEYFNYARDPSNPEWGAGVGFLPRDYEENSILHRAIAETRELAKAYNARKQAEKVTTQNPRNSEQRLIDENDFDRNLTDVRLQGNKTVVKTAMQQPSVAKQPLDVAKQAVAEDYVARKRPQRVKPRLGKLRRISMRRPAGARKTTGKLTERRRTTNGAKNVNKTFRQSNKQTNDLPKEATKSYKEQRNFHHNKIYPSFVVDDYYVQKMNDFNKNHLNAIGRHQNDILSLERSAPSSKQQDRGAIWMCSIILTGFLLALILVVTVTVCVRRRHTSRRNHDNIETAVEFKSDVFTPSDGPVFWRKNEVDIVEAIPENPIEDKLMYMPTDSRMMSLSPASSASSIPDLAFDHYSPPFENEALKDLPSYGEDDFEVELQQLPSDSHVTDRHPDHTCNHVTDRSTMVVIASV